MRSSIPRLVAGAVLVLVAGCVPNPGPPGSTTTTTSSTTTTTLPATTVEVTTTADEDDGVCDETHCSLREAIAMVDADASLDTVRLPAGHFVVGQVAMAEGASSLRASMSAGVIAAAVGPDGEGFRVTSDMTIEGVGAGDTVIDFSGDDYVIGWIAEASLTLRDLSVVNIGAGTVPADRIVVAGAMAAAGEEVVFERTVVDDIQPGMLYSPPAPGDPAPGGGKLVGYVPSPSVPQPPTGLAFDVRILDSDISDIAYGWGLVMNFGGDLEITDSDIEDAPAIALGPAGSFVVFPGSVRIAGSRLDGLASNPLGGGCSPVSVISGRGLVTAPEGSPPPPVLPTTGVEIADSTITGRIPAAGDSACGGAPTGTASISAGVLLSGDSSADVSRSLISGGYNVGGYSAAIALHAWCSGTDPSVVPGMVMADSTVWAATAALGIIYNVCGEFHTTAAGSGVSISRSTVTGIGVGGPFFGGGTSLNGPPIHVERSIILDGYGGTVVPSACNPLSSGSNAMLDAMSTGWNTSADSRCSLDATGDQAETDPMMGPLQDNGGPSLTAAPLPGSPVIDSAGTCSGTDQRGVTRPQGAECDRGAVEMTP